MARHAQSVVKDRDMSLKGHLCEYVEMMGNGLGRAIQAVEVR